MKTVDETRIELATFAIDAFAERAFGAPFEHLGTGDRADAFFDLLTALRVVADSDPALDWELALARCDDSYPERTAGVLC
jgi:hypothetical protein